jgi:hypothetical protein
LAKTLQINDFTYPYGSEVWLADYNLNFDKLDYNSMAIVKTKCFMYNVLPTKNYCFCFLCSSQASIHCKTLIMRPDSAEDLQGIVT